MEWFDYHVSVIFRQNCVAIVSPADLYKCLGNSVNLLGNDAKNIPEENLGQYPGNWCPGSFVARTSAAMILTMWYRDVLVSVQHKFKQPVIFQYGGMILYANTFYVKVNSAHKVSVHHVALDTWTPIEIFLEFLDAFFFLNSSRSSDAYIHLSTRTSLVHIMACRLIGAKPLSGPMLDYCRLDPKKHISMKFYLKL